MFWGEKENKLGYKLKYSFCVCVLSRHKKTHLYHTVK